MEALKKLRNEINFYIHSKTIDIEDVQVTSIPTVLENFLGSNDEWVSLPNLSINKDCTAVFYIGKEGNKFPEHKHSHSSEQMTMLNEGGKMRVITPQEDTIVSYPNSILIPKNTPHIVYFITDCELMIVWHPPFKEGWVAEASNTIEE